MQKRPVSQTSDFLLYQAPQKNIFHLNRKVIISFIKKIFIKVMNEQATVKRYLTVQSGGISYLKGGTIRKFLIVRFTKNMWTRFIMRYSDRLFTTPRSYTRKTLTPLSRIKIKTLPENHP
jgi:hypothetical protein